VRVVNDRRRLPRAQLSPNGQSGTQSGGVNLHSPRGSFAGTCLDVSAGGMAVLAPVVAKPKESFTIQAQLWGFPLRTHGLVVRCRPMLGVWFWGLRFEKLDGATKATLDSYVQQQLAYAARVRQAELFAARLRPPGGISPRVETPPRRPSEEAQRRVREFAPIPMLEDPPPAISGFTVVATFDDEWTRQYTPHLTFTERETITEVHEPGFDRITQVRGSPTLRVSVVPPNRARED
jgi:hypothetical protein